METRKCKFCGAEIDELTNKCPLCGMSDSAENESNADTAVSFDNSGGENTDIDSIISSLDVPTSEAPTNLDVSTAVEEPTTEKVDVQPSQPVELEKSADTDIDALVSDIGKDKEVKVATEPKRANEPDVKSASKMSNTKWWIISIVVLVLSAAAGCGIGYYYLSTLEQDAAEDVAVVEGTTAGDSVTTVVDLKSDDDQTAAAEESQSHRTFDYGSWSDLNSFFNADAVSMLDLGRYMVNTTELCYSEHRWSKPTLDPAATEAMVYAHPSLRIRTAPSTSSTSTVINGLLYGSMVRIIERVNSEWTEVEVISGDFEHPDAESAHVGLRGYVSTQFLTTIKMFNIMDRHVTPSVERREMFHETKWRRAMTDILYALGTTSVSPVVDIDIAAKFEHRDVPESLLVLRIESYEDDVTLLAFVEFYEADEEYRILGIVPGTGVAMEGTRPSIVFNGVGDYDIIYLNE